jgi:hypothetical protein
MPLSNEELIEIIQNCDDGVLDLASKNIGPEAAQTLAQALPGTLVHSLNLWDNNIDAVGALALAHALKKTAVHTLNLGNNLIRAEGALTLVRALKETSVHTLDLGCNFIGPEGAQALGQALKGTPVHTLSLYYNRIGDEGAQALAQALKETSVHALDLQDNEIGDEGTQALAQDLKGTLVTTVELGFYSPELSSTLKKNLGAKKSTMITLGQLSARGKFPPDLIDLMASFLPQACEPNHEQAIATIEASHEFSCNKAALHNASAQVIQRAWARHRLFRQSNSIDTEHSIAASNPTQL